MASHVLAGERCETFWYRISVLDANSSREWFDIVFSEILLSLFVDLESTWFFFFFSHIYGGLPFSCVQKKGCIHITWNKPVSWWVFRLKVRVGFLICISRWYTFHCFSFSWPIICLLTLNFLDSHRSWGQWGLRKRYITTDLKIAQGFAVCQDGYLQTWSHWSQTCNWMPNRTARNQQKRVASFMKDESMYCALPLIHISEN